VRRRSGREIGIAGKDWEDAVRQRTNGKSAIILGIEVDSVTDYALIQAKDINLSRPENFLNKSTRRQIKTTIEVARRQDKRAEFWFRNEPLPEIRQYIEEKGGIVKAGLQDQ
jgi:hypothetical protein